jgi:hypothetical protein
MLNGREGERGRGRVKGRGREGKEREGKGKKGKGREDGGSLLEAKRANTL